MTTAREHLDRALVDLAANGRRPLCGDYRGDDNPWLSDDHTQRAWAAQACQLCPLLDLCADAAAETGDRFGVWGGRDHSPRPMGRPKTTTKETA